MYSISLKFHCTAYMVSFLALENGVGLKIFSFYLIKSINIYDFLLLKLFSKSQWEFSYFAGYFPILVQPFLEE